MKKSWYVYLLECRDKSYYCGITTDITRRVEQHNNNKGAKYTAGRGPVSIVEYVEVKSKSDALQLEAFIKKCHKAIKPRAIRLFKKFINS
jgi:putative endonuclease